MSNAKPMTLERRLTAYLGRKPDGWVDRESDLTPARRRRAWHKALRNGERGQDEQARDGLRLLGRKGAARRRAGRAVAEVSFTVNGILSTP